MDLLDQKILTALDRNSRLSFSLLARLLRRGRDTIEYRAQRMIEDGIIRGCHAIIDHTRLGLTLYKCYLRFSADKNTTQEFLKRLRSHPRVLWLAEASGEWDLVVAIVAHSIHEFSATERSLFTPVSQSITEAEVYTVTRFRYYPMRFQAEAKIEGFSVGTGGEVSTIEDLDYQILLNLANRARTPVSTLAKDLGVSIGLINRHIEQLEKRGIILGYHVDLNLEALDLILYKTQLFLSGYQPGLEEKIRKWCEKQNEIFSFVEQVGQCRLEFETRCAHYRQYTEFIKNLRNSFHPFIRDTRTVTLHSLYLNWSVFGRLE